MKRLLPLLMLPLLAACLEPIQLNENGEVIPPPPPPLPPQVQAAMTHGLPRAFVFELGNGCWAVGIEQSEPRSGRALRDAAGNWICNDGVVAPDAVAVAAPAATEAPA